MMKKLLILMLVLGLASTASAVLISSTQGYYFRMDIDAPAATVYIGDTVDIEIFAGDTVAVAVMLTTVLNIDDAASAGVATISIPGDWLIVPTPTTTGDGSGGYNVNVSGTVGLSGIALDASIYSVSFVANGAGTVTIDATSGTWDTWIAVAGDGTAGEAWSSLGSPYGLPYYAQLTIVPEPMTLALLGLGGLLLRRRKGG